MVEEEIVHLSKFSFNLIFYYDPKLWVNNMSLELINHKIYII